jgi:membrane fusion protein, multidrug efflux system
VTWTRILAGLLVLIGGGYAALLWLRGPLVTAATAQRGDVAEVVYATGAIEPLTWSKVLPLLRARIVAHCRCEGQLVTKGQVLAKLDDTAAQAELAQVLTKRNFAEGDVKRLANLIATGATTRLTLERAETELRQLDSQIAALRARLTDYLLVAPKEGIVLRADGQVGDIPVTTDVLFWVGQPKPLQVIADVNEEDIAKVSLGQVALLRNDGFPNGNLSATVASITPKGDPVTKTFRAYLALPEESPLRIGMSVEANIVIRERKAALLVPAEAIRTIKGKAHVLAIENGRLRQVSIETGIRGSRLVEVVAGLAEGATLASPVKAEYADGQSVRVAP